MKNDRSGIITSGKRTSKNRPYKVFGFALFLSITFLISCRNQELGDLVCFRNHCISVEIAATASDRSRGLQNRSFLGEDAGMLFIFPRSGYFSFWMKDTLIPLDMIWLDQSRRIVHIQDNATPCPKDAPCLSYTPMATAMYVLELNAGKAQRLGLKKGDQMEFHLPKYLSRKIQ